jgi:hypothetical protein
MTQFCEYDKTQLNIKDQNPAEILQECCKSRAHAIILTLQEKRVYYHARLFSISDNSLTLRLTRKLIKAPVPGSTCYFSFIRENSNLSFFSNVLQYHHNSPDRHADLILDIHSGTMRSETRLAYRVNVTPASQLVVSLITNSGLILRPKARDLSLIGIGIDFTGEEVSPKLEVGSIVEIDLRLPPDDVKLKGEVRQRLKMKYGIRFTSVVNKYGIKPPPALKNILSALEREWLREISRE